MLTFDAHQRRVAAAAAAAEIWLEKYSLIVSSFGVGIRR